MTGSVAADLIGVAVFAASGAFAGVAKRLDIFGVVFVGAVAALGGGILRDLLIGAIPPYALTHWPYLVVAIALVVFGVRMLALRRKWSAPPPSDHGLLGPSSRGVST